MDIELDNKEFQNVWRLVSESTASVFMTGRAGTGKSTFLRYIVEHIEKKTVVLAPTGIAAVNAGGVTLHSFFKIPLEPLALDDVRFSTPRAVKEMQKFNKEKIKLLNEVELIVIDEVSMVRADVLDFVDRVLRTYNKGHRGEPFGGKQLLMVGDAFQLEPVASRQEWDILRLFYQTPYFFGAAVFRQIRLTQIELKKVYRQKEVEFLSLLDNVRVGMARPQDLKLINTRVDAEFEPEEGTMYMTLTATRAASDLINENKLAELETGEVTLKGEVQGEFPETAMPTNRLLTLKVGAQVVFVRNDMEGRWYNGTVGRVEGIEDDGVWVRVDRDPDDYGYKEVDAEESGEEGMVEVIDHDSYFVEPVQWENVKYRYDEKEHKVTTDLLGTFTQVPIRLAWAITIHKSQGLTFDHVIVDLGRGAFACGQCYVALSRCRTLQGMVLRTPVTPRDIIASAAVRVFSNGANDERLIQGQLDAARADAMVRRAVKEFGDGDYRGAVCDAMEYFAMRPDMLRSEAARRLVARKFGVIGRLEGRVGELMEEMRKMREKTFEFAYEYYLLAAECLNKYDDTRAAKANLNKALALAPDYGEALVMRGRLMLEGGDPEGAIGDLDVVLREGKLRGKGKVAEALLLRARARRDMRQWEGAFDDAVDSLNKDKTRGACLLLVEICRHLDREEDADMFSLMADDLLKKKKRKGYDDEEDDE